MRAQPESKLLGALAEALPATVGNVYVAFSGGVDSSVLLALSAKLNLKNLGAVHINHDIHPDSDLWERQCQEFSESLMVTFTSYKAAINLKSGNSVEAMAREARYELMARKLKENDVLLTAQHQDDQVETVLLRLMRGSGPVGLSAMPKQRELGLGMLIRPWLEVSKSELLEYAQVSKLKWLEDDSNQDTRFDRNFLRHQIIPTLKSRWPSVGKTISRSARLCREMTSIADHFTTKTSDTLEISKLDNLELSQAATVIYQWLRGLKVLVPSMDSMEKIVSEVAWAQEDSNPQVSWPDGQIRRYRDKLYYLASPVEHKPNNLVYKWRHADELYIKELDVLLHKKVSATGFVLREGSKLQIRFYQGGEKIKPRGSRYTRKLKKIFQEQAIPPWQRINIPLVYVDDVLVQVVGIDIVADFVESHEPRFEVQMA